MPRIGIWCGAFFLAKHLQVSDNHRTFAGNYVIINKLSTMRKVFIAAMMVAMSMGASAQTVMYKFISIDGIVLYLL